jgi:hypothetical protein
MDRLREDKRAEIILRFFVQQMLYYYSVCLVDDVPKRLVHCEKRF